VLTHTVYDRTDALQIWIPAAAARIVRVADDVSETRPLAAKFTSHCHKYSSPHPQNSHKVQSLAEFSHFRILIVRSFQGNAAHFQNASIIMNATAVFLSAEAKP
jgi:hypothetical protein